jgi:hypothetical protein
MVRERLRFERAQLLQQGDLLTAAAAYRFALRLEVLRRIEEAQAVGDQARLASLLTPADRWIAAL